MNSGIYDTKDNFAVVIQPALQVLPRNQVITLCYLEIKIFIPESALQLWCNFFQEFFPLVMSVEGCHEAGDAGKIHCMK